MSDKFYAVAVGEVGFAKDWVKEFSYLIDCTNFCRSANEGIVSSEYSGVYEDWRNDENSVCWVLMNNVEDVKLCFPDFEEE